MYPVAYDFGRQQHILNHIKQWTNLGERQWQFFELVQLHYDSADKQSMFVVPLCHRSLQHEFRHAFVSMCSDNQKNLSIRLFVATFRLNSFIEQIYRRQMCSCRMKKHLRQPQDKHWWWVTEFSKVTFATLTDDRKLLIIILNVTAAKRYK